MEKRRVIVEPKVGLHARPAALFVQTAMKAHAVVTVAKWNGAPVNAKSILSVLGLDARHGDQITIAADGEGADKVLDQLEALVTAPEPGDG
ncbi:MAG: phosphocarrier protein HPr [Streptosporangiaceae bacterium]|jgi:phosphocarrier protein|nr:phosphoenolpyruvate--protein phosphotransferase [Streptosporangiaceae bacterium]MDX6429540.1 phosphocarrier protein HPr [Streptosporangiaceae bacterium]